MLVHDLVEANRLGHWRDASWELGADGQNAARTVPLVCSSAEQSSLASVAAYMCLSSLVKADVADRCPASPSVPDVYNFHLDAERR